MELEEGSLAAAAEEAGAEVTVVDMEVTEYPPVVTLAPLPLEDATILTIVEEGARIVARAEALKVTDITTAKLATDDLAIIGGIKKRMGDKKKEYASPVRELLTEVNAAFDNVMAPVLEADTILRGKYGDYVAEEARKEEEQRKIVRLQEEAAERSKALTESGGEAPEPAPVVVEVVPAPERTRGNTGALTSTRKVHKARVINFGELSDDYKVADMVTLNALAKNRKGENPPAGVEFFIETGIQVRR